MNWQTIFAQGLGAQTEQQDSGGAWPSPDGKQIFVVLADGAGGHQGGQLASRAAVDTAKALWEKSPPAERGTSSFLENISRAAHDAVTAQAKSERSCRTTWVAFLANETEAHWVHSGDSRLYHFAAGKLVSRTLDHSVVQVLVEKGKVTESEIPTHPDRSTLLQSLGGPEYIQVEVGSVQLSDHDVFLLCTDGLWSQLLESDLLAVVQAKPDQHQRLLDELIAKAAQQGGDRADNATAWLIRAT